MDEHEAPRAEAGIVAVHDAEGQRYGHGGVYGVAARREGANARLRGERLHRGHDAVAPLRRRCRLKKGGSG